MSRGLRCEEDGVTDVLGTILMVGITIGMMTGLTLLVLGAAGPQDQTKMDAQFAIRPGADGQWGTADETVTLRNAGGESLQTSAAVVRITVNDAATEVAGAALGQGFADGSFGFGDTWQIFLTIPQDARVRVHLIDTGANAVVASGALTAINAPVGGGPAVTTYVTSDVAVTGSVASFANAQNATDAGAEAVLTEAAGTGTALKTVHANGVSLGQTHPDWSNAANAVGQDDADATTTSNQARNLQVTTADPTAEGSVTQVVLKARVAITGYSNDHFRLQACFGSTCGTQSGDLAGAGGYTVIQYDATAARPGTGAWSWADINNLEIRIQNTRTGNVDGTWRVDHMWAEVHHTTASGFDMDIRFHWSGVPAGDQQLQLRYRVTDDTFGLQVWNGLSWNTRGVLDQSGASVFSYDLLSSEYNAGSPRIRMIDLDTGIAAGAIHIDYARVVTS